MNNIEKLELAIANNEKNCILVFNKQIDVRHFILKGYVVTQIKNDLGEIVEQSFLVENMVEYLEFLRQEETKNEVVLDALADAVEDTVADTVTSKPSTPKRKKPSTK